MIETCEVLWEMLTAYMRVSTQNDRKDLLRTTKSNNEKVGSVVVIFVIIVVIIVVIDHSGQSWTGVKTWLEFFLEKKIPMPPFLSLNSLEAS